jgi:TfoX N-terminal domain
MFSYPAAFANTWMFAGVFQDSIFARLAPDSPTREAFAPFAPMQGRPMRELWVIPEEVLDDEAQLTDILEEARRYVETLPPKPEKPPRKKKASPPS